MRWKQMQCKHCGKELVQSMTGNHHRWRHDVTFFIECVPGKSGTKAEPDDIGDEYVE